VFWGAAPSPAKELFWKKVLWNLQKLCGIFRAKFVTVLFCRCGLQRPFGAPAPKKCGFWGAAPSPAKEPFLKKGSLKFPKNFVEILGLNF
jgi:hypothetical protein